MTDFVQVLKDYEELEKLFKDSSNYFCYSTINGRRLILKKYCNNKCVPIDNNFKMVSFANETDETLYKNPLELIKSYSTNGDVRISNILITKDKIEAFNYLMEKNK